MFVLVVSRDPPFALPFPARGKVQSESGFKKRFRYASSRPGGSHGKSNRWRASVPLLFSQNHMQVATSYKKANPRRIAEFEKSQINVLIVEDDVDDYRTISRLLSRLEGYSVTATRASSGLAARSGLSTSRYDVVIADYKLGPETGVDVIKSISRKMPAIAPILVSGSLSTEVQMAAFNAGAIHCIEKSRLTVKSLEFAIQSAIEAVFSGAEVAGGKLHEPRPWLH
jgi:CheY-like chemotaxis protein